jgi:hypothetical protein
LDRFLQNPDAYQQTTVKIRELLLMGNRKAAVDTAVNAQMWPEAMLLASFTDKEEYKKVLCNFFSAHYGLGDPCRSLYMAFADQQEKSIHEPQKLLNTGETPRLFSPILSCWVTHAQMLLANRSPDTNKVLTELGDRLWKECDAIEAAHVCYLLAGTAVEAPSPTSRIALLGADHRSPHQARFYVSPTAVQTTEIYEWIQKKANANSLMIPFQGYKLIYAMILSDFGKLETAFKYVDSMLTIIKAITATMQPGTSMYLEGMQNQLTVLDDRLRQHLGQARVDSVAASSDKSGKWGLGSALSIMGKIVNRVVEGTDATPGTGSAPGSTSGKQPLYPGAPRSNGSQSGEPQFHGPPGYTGARQTSPFMSTPQSSERFPSGPTVPMQPPALFLKSTSEQLRPPHHGSFAASEKIDVANAHRTSEYKLNSESMDTSSSGISSDKGSSSPKFKDSPSKEKSVKSKTPPPSSSKSTTSSTGSGSGWLSGISSFLTNKINPDAKVAKLGEQMEAYFDEEKKRWVFPGEASSEEPPAPSAPPTGPMPPSSSSDGPPGLGGSTPAVDDPLASLMAPPTMRAHAQLMNKDPVAAMMAPPSRPGIYGQRANSMPIKRPPPRPQFAVFKPTTNAPCEDSPTAG